MLNPDPKKLRYLGIPLHSRRVRRVVSVVYFTLYALAIGLWCFHLEQHQLLFNVIETAALGFLLPQLGPFRRNGPVRDPEPDRSYLKGKVMLRDMDDWSRHFHGAVFDQLRAEAQTDILRRYRVGNWLFPAGAQDNTLDERELVEWNVACRDALRIQTSVLAITGGVFLGEFTSGHADPRLAVSILLGTALLGQTLPKAVVFWNEPDPFAAEAVAEAVSI